MASASDVSSCGCEREPHTCESDEDRRIADLEQRLTEAILRENVARQEAARAEAERDRVSALHEGLRVQLRDEIRAHEKTNQALAEAEEEIRELRANVRDAFA